MNPTLFFIPCFSGSPWDLGQLQSLAHLPLRTARLPEGLHDVDAYADFVAGEAGSLDGLVLVGDSFGALVGLSVAARRPRNLRGLVLSGGFAANPVKSGAVKLMAKLLPVLGGGQLSGARPEAIGRPGSASQSRSAIDKGQRPAAGRHGPIWRPARIGANPHYCTTVPSLSRQPGGAY